MAHVTSMIVTESGSICDCLQMSMRVDEQCKFLCVQTLDAARAKAFRTRVEEGYRVNMCAAAPCLL